MSTADQATNVFGTDDKPVDNTQTSETTEQTTPTPLQVPEAVADLVGEGKKYSDLNSALNSIKPAQEHINRLEQDNKTLRDEIAALKADLSARQSVADVLDKLGNQSEAEQQSSYTPEQIKQLVQGALQEEKIASTTQSNINAVNTALLDMYGDKAKEKVAQKAQELGMSVKTLQDLAAQSPKAVLAYFNTNSQQASSPRMQQTNLSALGDPEPQKPAPGASWKEIGEYLAKKQSN